MTCTYLRLNGIYTTLFYFELHQTRFPEKKYTFEYRPQKNGMNKIKWSDIQNKVGSQNFLEVSIVSNYSKYFSV